MVILEGTVKLVLIIALLIRVKIMEPVEILITILFAIVLKDSQERTAVLI